MKTADFDYHLPPELIAQTPIEPRDAARLLIVRRSDGSLEHRRFRDLHEYLAPGDLLVMNQSRVIPARLHARKVPSGGRVEVLLLTRHDERTWEALVGGRRARTGTRLVIEGTGGTGGTEGDHAPRNTQYAIRSTFDASRITDHGSRTTHHEQRTTDNGPLTTDNGLTAEVIAETPSGGRLIRFSRPVDDLLESVGEVPLPPYIHTPLTDRERYQTVYACVAGSVAAPTAGLHFTPGLLEDLHARGIRFAQVTLHIGLDTFRPVQEENVEEHAIHREWCRLDEGVAAAVAETRAAGKRVVAVGTTSVRVLETAARQAAESGSPDPVAPFSGWTDLFIYPGYRFRAVDALVTNFHLPRSTLLMLVGAFAGRELMLRAYEEAIHERYRFYSFGDAMLIL